MRLGLLLALTSSKIITMEAQERRIRTEDTSLIRTILSSEVKFVVSIIVFVFGVVTPYFSIRQDIALIKSDVSNINANHEVHIQDIVQEIKEMKTEQEKQRDDIISLQKQILVLLDRQSH